MKWNARRLNSAQGVVLGATVGALAWFSVIGATLAVFG
jgi:hypothetical protein